jgi:hypothetical protein
VALYKIDERLYKALRYRRDGDRVSPECGLVSLATVGTPVLHIVIPSGDMARAISVRLDDEADRALRTLEASGLTQSEAIRAALLASVQRLRRSKQLALEVAALEADPDDREEMLSVASLMENLRAPR